MATTGKYEKGVFRFKVGDKVWVRDRRGWSDKAKTTARGGYRIVEATVRETHYHPDRHPFYPYGEGYSLDGQLWWDCYPGCRVFATREEATKARLDVDKVEYEHRARLQNRDLEAAGK